MCNNHVGVVLYLEVLLFTKSSSETLAPSDSAWTFHTETYQYHFYTYSISGFELIISFWFNAFFFV